MILRIPFILLIALFPALIVSGQVRFTTVAGSQEIGKGDYVQVQFKVENAKQIDQFTPPDFSGFELVQEPSQSSGMTMINGNSSQYEAVTYVLRSTKTGKFTIGGASALVDGKKMTSNPVTITVTATSSGNKGNSANNNNSINPFPQMPWPDMSAMEPDDFKAEYLLRPGENVKEKIRKNLFLKVLVDKTTCYVGEPIVATYKLYSRLRAESRETKPPTLNGFSVYDMVEPGTEPSSVEKVDGKPYMVHVLHKAQLIPLQARTVELDPIEVENTVHFAKAGKRQPSRNSSDPFSELFDRMSGEEAMGPETVENVTLDTKPLAITVKPLPEENKPADFNGAVGKFSIDAELANRNISAQDEADLRVTVKGSGNLPVINAPQVNWPSGVTAFDPKAKEEINKMAVPLSGSKTFDYIFTTSDPGHYTIPPIAFSYFDPSARAYKRIQSNALDFEVTPAVKRKGLPADLSAAADRKEGLKDLIDRHLESLFAILILSCLAFYLWRQNRRLRRSEGEKKGTDGVRGPGAAGEGSDSGEGRTAGDGSHPGDESVSGLERRPAGGRISGAGGGASAAGAIGAAGGRRERTERTERPALQIDPLSDVKIRLENGDYKGFYRELNRVVWKAVSDKLNLPASELNKHNIVRKLEEKGWDATTTLSLEHLLSECEMNLYTPDYDTYNMQQLLGQAESLLRILISNTAY